MSDLQLGGNQTDIWAAELVQTALIAGWSYVHTINVYKHAEMLARTYKLKNEWFENKDGIPDIKPIGNPLNDHGKLIAQCLMQWGASFNTAINVLQRARTFANMHLLQTGWKNDTGFVIKPGEPQVTPIPSGDR